MTIKKQQNEDMKKKIFDFFEKNVEMVSKTFPDSYEHLFALELYIDLLEKEEEK